ncbi:MAG: T9SS type A sorting domain-containing protein [Bacteroidetes bacterium]|nr:T9SS type A sorting domain-containing protein [Bacteroidota bacterium]
MIRINTIIFLGLIIGSLLPHLLLAQSYKKFSAFAGGNAAEETISLKEVNGETYLLGYTKSSNFPVTNGTTYKGFNDITLVKYDVAGNVLYATYLGGTGDESNVVMQVINGEVLLSGNTSSSNFPVTNGTPYHGGTQDVFVTRLSSTGSITFSTLIGGSKAEFITNNGLQVLGNEIIIAGNTSSLNFPSTNGVAYAGGTNDFFITKINSTNGNIIASTLIGGTNADVLTYATFDNDNFYIMGNTLSDDIPITIGSPVLNDPNETGFIASVRRTDLNINYARYLGGPGTDYVNSGKLHNGILYVCGFTYSLGFPVTNGSAPNFDGLDYLDGFYTKLDNAGNILFSTYLSTNELDVINSIEIDNDEIYLVAGTGYNPFNGERKLILFKFNDNNDLLFSKKIGLGFGAPAQFPLFYKVVNGNFYVAGICNAATYPVTNGSQFFSGGTGYFTKIDGQGSILYSSFLGKMNNILPLQFSNNKFIITASTDLASYPMTDFSVPSGNTDNVLIVKNTNGTDVYSGYIGGADVETPVAVQVNADDIYIAGKTFSANYPVTNTVLYKGNGDQFISKISFCPDKYFTVNDTLSPKIQTACKFGLGQKIIGSQLQVPSDSLPVIYLNGIATPQPPVTANFQWQIANSINGPWIDIPAAVFKDYTPQLGAFSQYYRRLSYTASTCGSQLIHISDTASVLANTLTAPTVNTGGTLITCPGTAVTLGGSPTATDGNPPYVSYIWDNGAAPVPNPTVTVSSNTIFTIIVTDSEGCQQIGQAVVLTHRADAGPDKGACGGSPAQIGTFPIPGAGITYSWQPSTGLNAGNIAQPLATPAIVTSYELTLSIPVSGGGICITKDTVVVTPVAAPTNTNIAGPDKVICLGDSASIGSTAQGGFNYVWSPGSYLTGNTTATTWYYPGNITMPEPNPAILFLTAQRNGCSFPDETVVATIEARAGLDGCGPRIIGLPDRTPGINEVYSWSVISGTGAFLGPTDQPQVAVGASVGGPTIYELTVTYNGHSCSDQVKVPADCGGCVVHIDVNAQYDCPDFDTNGGSVTLVATSGLLNAVYTWSPQVGLSSYTGSTVQLTDDVPRVYFVTATNLNDTSVHCTTSIFVNDPAYSLPVFNANDTVTCAGQPVTIGAPPVAGYTYEWSGAGLSSNLISNPVATIFTQTSYPVLITDGNGCKLKDTVLVSVQNSQVNGGPDWVICSGGTVQLGTGTQPNTTYLWEPQTSPWQNGTNQFSAQPQVFVATNADFIVTATTSAGCITKDTVQVVVNANAGIPDAPDKFICKGSTVVIGSPAISGATYQWTPATGLSNPTVAQPVASPQVTTTYTLTVTFQGSCAISATDQVTVTVGSASFSMPDINFCPGSGAVSLGNNAPAGMISYSWTPTALVTNPNIANPSTLNPPPSVTTQFTLLVTDANGCKYRDTILLIPAITKPDAGPDKVICKFSTTNIGSAANPVSPDFTYSWTPATNLSDPSSPNPVFTGTTGGTFNYILTVTSNLVTCTSSDTVQIKVIDISFPQLNNPTICQNSCVQIGTTPVQGVQYQWFPSTGLSDSHIANPVACVGSSTVSYTLTATNLNDCFSSATTVIGVYPLPAAQATIPPVSACLGDLNTFFSPSINPPGNYLYTWTPDNGTLSDIHSLTPVISLTNVGSSTYFLQITDTSTGCANIAIGNVTVNLCPDLSVIGDYMWFDLNGNGIQDVNEIGVSGMEVKLYNNAGFNVATTATNSDGYYQFSNVQPGNDYYVIFTKPAGYSFTLQNIGGVAAADNSKADATGQSNNFNVPPASSILNIDAGIVTGSVPVTLLSFTARLRNNNTVLLNWQTTAEVNNDYFDVERSIDGINFATIGRVEGHGTTLLPNNYALIDPNPVSGYNYYRLRQVDYDAHFMYSHTEVVELKKPELVTVFYNEQQNSIQVQFSNSQNNLRLKLYSANGQLIKSATEKNNNIAYTFQLPVLATGIYMLELVSDKERLVKKIFISK